GEAESTVPEIDSARSRSPSTRWRSAFAWRTVPCTSLTRGSVSLRSSSIVSCRAVIVRMRAPRATRSPPAATATTTAMATTTQSRPLIGPPSAAPLSEARAAHWFARTARSLLAVSLVLVVLLHAFGDLPLGAVLGGLVVRAALDFGGPVGLRHPGAWIVVRILVPLAVAEFSGRVVGGVTQVLGDLAGGPVAHIGLGPTKGEIGPVRLGSGGQIDDGVGQVQLGLGQTHELHGPGRGVGHDQGHGVGHADVLAGQHHH